MSETEIINEGCLYRETILDFIQNKREGTINPKLTIWHSRIPYTFEVNFPVSKIEKIECAIKKFNDVAKKNSINLIFETKHPRDSEYVYFIHDQNISRSTIGHRKSNGLFGDSPNTITIADWAEEKDILHEVMHTLGFAHEHQRIDKRTTAAPFTSDAQTELFLIENVCNAIGIPLTPYDRKSILHYPNVFWYKENGIDKRFELRVNDIEKEVMVIDKVPTTYAQIQEFIKARNILDKVEINNPMLFTSSDSCLSYFHRSIEPQKSQSEPFSHWDIYILKLLYGEAECNYNLSKEAFVQAYFLCATCNLKVCIFCGYKHHYEHKLLDKIPKQHESTPITEYKIVCECMSSRCKRRI